MSYPPPPPAASPVSTVPTTAPPASGNPVANGSGSLNIRHGHDGWQAVDMTELLSDSLFTNCKTPPFHLESIETINLPTLQNIASNGHWDAVRFLSNRLLYDVDTVDITDYNLSLEESTEKAKERCILIILRLESLFRLKMYDELSRELQNHLLTITTSNQEILQSNKNILQSDEIKSSIEITSNHDLSPTTSTTTKKTTTRPTSQRIFSSDTFMTEGERSLLTDHTTNMIASLDLECALRLLFSEVNLITGHAKDGFEQLHQLICWLVTLETEKKWNPIKITYWRWHGHLQMINAYTRNRSWKKAIQLLRTLIIGIDDMLKEFVDFDSDSVEEGQTSSLTIEEKNDLLASKAFLLLRSAKLLLQLGALRAASIHVEEAGDIVSSCEALSVDASLTNQLLMGRGLIYFAKERFEEAHESFHTVIDVEHARAEASSTSNFVSNSSSFYSHPNIASALRHLLQQSKDECPLSAAVNNYCIVSLYLLRTQDAIARLEKLILQNPVRYMTDPIVFNLCTMYEVSFSPDTSNQKKRAIQKLAVRYNISDVLLHWRSFRLSN